MTKHQPAFYRSPVTRWSFIATGAFLTVTLSPWAHGWHDVRSLLWLHQLLPWWLMSLGFAIYTLLQLAGTVNAAVVADFLGLFFYLCEFIALSVTASGNPKNGFFFAALALVCVLHFAAGRLALIQRES